MRFHPCLLRPYAVIDSCLGDNMRMSLLFSGRIQRGVDRQRELRCAVQQTTAYGAGMRAGCGSLLLLYDAASKIRSLTGLIDCRL